MAAATENVVVKMSAEDAGVFEAWQKAKQGPEAMADAMQKASEKGKKGGDDVMESLTKQAGKWASVGVAIEAVKKTLVDYYETKRKLEEEGASSTAQVDAAMRKVYQTFLITDEKQQEAAARRIGGVAQGLGVPLAAAAKGAETLGRFGFTPEQAQGASLKELLMMQQGLGVSPDEAAVFQDRILAVLSRTKQGKTPEAIRRFGVLARSSIGKIEGFKPEWIEEFAKVATATEEAGVDPITGAAMFFQAHAKVDKKQAYGVYGEWLKPGMQKGEIEARQRIAKLTDTNALTQYEQAINIGIGSVAAKQETGKTGALLTQGFGKELGLADMRQNLIAELGKMGVQPGTPEYISRIQSFEHPYGQLPIPFFGDALNTLASPETRVRYATEPYSQYGAAGSDKAQVQRDEYLKSRREAIMRGEQQTIKLEHTFKGADGRDVHVDSKAKQIQGR